MIEGASLVRCLAEHQDNSSAYYDAVRALDNGSGVGWDESLRGGVATAYDSCVALLASRSLTRERTATPTISATDLAACAARIMNAQLMFSETDEAIRRR